MKRFRCEACGGEVFFDSRTCVRCGADLGYVFQWDDLIDLRGPSAVGGNLVRCANAERARCTWLSARPSGLCESCELTRTRPADADLDGLALFPVAEEAKRHLLRDLRQSGLDVRGTEERWGGDPERGLAFDLLSSSSEPVTIGHADGVITMDLAEGDDSHREKVRRQLAEPYRTMLGHFRHESGHYAEWLLVEGTPLIEDARDLFGDERADYQSAIDAHYDDGAPTGWERRYLSEYATMHPYEDFAETWAHCLHIHDTLETAEAFGLVAEVDPGMPFADLVREVWLPFATAMNVVNRSLGQRDAYPFTLPDPVIDKLVFVERLLAGRGAA